MYTKYSAVKESIVAWWSATLFEEWVCIRRSAWKVGFLHQEKQKGCKCSDI